jgi:hypothetical protein
MNITGFPIMPAMCASCPFRDGGDIALRNAVMSRTILQASQVCHHPRIHGKRETHLCRGARDQQLTILYRLGLIAEETDAAFMEASQRYLGGRV